MSCGNPHATPCSEVLARVYEYIDNEVDGHDRERIHQHLDECGPCLKEFGLEEVVKAVVRRSCGHDPIPEDLRAKVLHKIATARDQAQGEAVT